MENTRSSGSLRPPWPVLVHLFPAAEPLAGVGLEEPDEQRLAVTPTTAEEQDLSKRVILVERTREGPSELMSVGEKTQRTRPFSDGGRLTSTVEYRHC